MKRLFCITIAIFIIIISFLIVICIDIRTQYKSEKNKCQFYSNTILDIYSNIFTYAINNEQWIFNLSEECMRAYEEKKSNDIQLIYYANDTIMNEMTNYMAYFPKSRCYMTYYYDIDSDTTIFNIIIDDDDGMRYTFTMKEREEIISFSGFDANGMYGIRGD